MQYIRDSFWLGREFISLEQIQAQALHWCREVAGRRKARPLGGRAPIEVFEQHEAGTLTSESAARALMRYLYPDPMAPARAAHQITEQLHSAADRLTAVPLSATKDETR
jgi:hypothetical protein